jgi:hypothetical protein
MLFAACSDDFFDKYPTDSWYYATTFGDTYIRSAGDAQNLLYAAYGNMREQFGRSIVYIGDLPTDNAYCYKIVNSTDHITLHESAVQSNNGVMGNLWSTAYEIIARCNIVIDVMTEKFSTDTKYHQLVGEAKFLRGYVYYVLVRVFGPVPHVLHELPDHMASFDYGRTDVETVYVQIIQDLSDAINTHKLPPTYTTPANIGKATSVAAQAILADVYLTRKEYSKAQPLYEAIIAKADGTNLGLIAGTDYKDIFSATNVNNREIIFAIRYGYMQTPSLSNYLMGASLGNIQGANVNPPGYTNSKFRGVNLMMMTTELERKYAATDLRRSVVLAGEKGVRDTQYEGEDYPLVVIPQTLKYFDYRNLADGTTGTNPQSGCPVIISRYADVILKYAECLNETDPAAAIVQIRKIRDRAGVETNINAAKEDVAAAIALERQLELGLEGHRWFDLVRTGQLQTVMNEYYSRGTASLDYLPEYVAECEFGPLNVKAKVDNHEVLFPIPLAQHLLNPEKLTQNEGY